MLVNIDKKVTNYEALHLFNLLLENDCSPSHTTRRKEINFTNFRKIFIEYDFVDINDKGTSILQDLREIIKLN